jgi:putative addiction module component (TIGR02574 family)
MADGRRSHPPLGGCSLEPGGLSFPWRSAVPHIPDGFDELSPAEKIRYVQDLWDRIAEDAASVPLTEGQREEIDRREAEHDRNPGSAVSWDEVKRRMRQPTE